MVGNSKMIYRIFEMIDDPRFSHALNERMKERNKIKADRFVFWKYLIVFGVGLLIGKFLLL